MIDLTATVLITTKNRKDDLRLALNSALSQTAPCEILVIDDGSTDGTASMLEEDFPTVRFIRKNSSEGYIIARNEGADNATGDIIFSIDDDAIFSSPNIVSQVLGDFSDPRIAAVAIPFINVNQDNKIRQISPADSEIFITDSYIGTAHAVRRDIFKKLKGYRPTLFHQGEEEDLCIRLLDQGYFVRLGTADPIHHFESANRDLTRQHMYGPRNVILFCWHNIPFPELLFHLTVASLNIVMHGLSIGQPILKFRGLFMGYTQILSGTCKREPVKRSTYYLFRRIRSSYIPLREISSKFSC